jgi:nucleoid-associated protein YgaU
MVTTKAPRSSSRDRTSARTAMNRQVGPSIVLSVLIVCFFAVALFQRDPPRSARAKSGRGETELSPRTASVSEDVRVKRSKELPEPSQPPKRIAARRDVKAHSPSGSGDASIAQVQPAPTRSRVVREAASIVNTGLKTADSAGLVRAPVSAFTVVQANETIRDVAVRVYGSSEHVGTLWRANRDALPLSDSPLSSGIVLRTPSVR